MYEKRRELVLDFLNEHPVCTVKEVAEKIQVSKMTVRRDLERLENEGVVRRSFGEVSLVKGLHTVRVAKIRAENMVTEKKAIAKAAFGLVPENCTVFMDAGSTVGELTRLLAKKHVVIATACVQTALMAINKKASVFLSGGQLDRESCYNLEGITAEHFFLKMNADFAFVSAGGVDIESGVSEFTQSNANLKSVMLERAKTKVLLADSSKYGVSKAFEACALSSFDIVITDKQINEVYVKWFAQKGIQLMRV